MSKGKNLLKIKKAFLAVRLNGLKALCQIALNEEIDYTSALDTGFKSDVLNQSNRYQNIFLNFL